MMYSPFKRLLVVPGAVALCLMPLASVSTLNAHTSMSVTFLGDWGGEAKTDFNAILTYCDKHYHTTVSYQQAPGGDVGAALTIRVQGHTPPDLATLTAPNVIQAYVSGNALVPITWLNKSTFNSQYSNFWRSLGTYNRKLYVIYMKADVKSLVWYSPKKLKAGHYSIPKTWRRLVALSRKMVSQGKQPWAFGVGPSPFSPWTLTDFIENIFLNTYGPTEYIKWYEHKIPWTGPEVKHVFALAGQIIANNLFTELQKWFKDPSSTNAILSQLEARAKQVYQ